MTNIRSSASDDIKKLKIFKFLKVLHADCGPKKTIDFCVVAVCGCGRGVNQVYRLKTSQLCMFAGSIAITWWLGRCMQAKTATTVRSSHSISIGVASLLSSFPSTSFAFSWNSHLFSNFSSFYQRSSFIKPRSIQFTHFPSWNLWIFQIA